MSNETLDLATTPTITASKLLFENGDASEPSVTFTDDTNCGLFWSTVNKLSLSIGGSAAINYQNDQTINHIPLHIEDTSAPAAPGDATSGYLYKKAADDNLYWKTLGTGEFNLSGASGGSGEFKDSEFKIFDETNTSRKLRFELSNLATDATHTWVVPQTDYHVGYFSVLPNATSLTTMANCSKSTFGNNNTMYSGNAMVSSSTTGVRNTGFGYDTLNDITTATDNTSIGAYANSKQTNGGFNTSVGYNAGTGTFGTFMSYDVSIGNNTITSGYATHSVAVGNGACYNGRDQYLVFVGSEAGGDFYTDDITNPGSVGVGYQSLHNLSTGSYNTALGTQSADTVTTGSNNVVIGYRADTAAATDNAICIGNDTSTSTSNSINIGNSTDHTTNYQAGIRGVTTGNADAVAVLIDSAGQLGTISSSRRYKENINPIDNIDNLYNLNPVSFNYKTQPNDITFGLIAEEVHEVLPDIVVYKDRDGEKAPETVQYHLLSPLILSMIKNNKQLLDDLDDQLTAMGL